ncbi:28490_t:CDS:2, partial [Gigaspora margarita]
MNNDKEHEFHITNLCEIVRDIAEDLVEDVKLFNRSIQSGGSNNNEQEIEKILDKFSLNRTNDIGKQIDQMQGSQWSNLDSHKNFT